MHTVALLKEAIFAAEGLGYSIRQEWLDGSGGGACEIGGKKWLFLDLALSPLEQLDQVIEALRGDPGIFSISCSAELYRLLGLRRSA